MQSFWHKNGVADNFHNFQLHFIVQLCEGVVLLRFADEGVALAWTSTSTSVSQGTTLALASRFQLARYSQFYFRVTLKRKRKVKVAAKLAFLLAAHAACISFGHFAHIAATSSSSSSSSFVVHRLLAGSVLYFISSAFALWRGKFMLLNDFKPFAPLQ